MIGGRKTEPKEIKVTEVRVNIGRPVNQDATAILITRTDEDGKRFHVSDFVWQEMSSDYNMCDITGVATSASVVVTHDKIKKHVAR